MDEQTRQALHGAVGSAVTLSKDPFDVYKYEASSWLIPGLTRHEVIRRVLRHLALVQESSSDANVALFRIEQSTKYKRLRVTFENDALTGYELSTNGKPPD